MNFMDSTMLLVGHVPQHFFDNVVLEQIQDVTKTFHSPVKEPGPLIQKDRPWENVPYFTVNGWTVLRDGDAGEFRCWYENWGINPGSVDPGAAASWGRSCARGHRHHARPPHGRKAAGDQRGVRRGRIH